MNVKKVQNIDILKTHVMTGTALNTNEFLQFLVVHMIVIAFSKISYSVCVNFNVDFCNKYAYL